MNEPEKFEQWYAELGLKGVHVETQAAWNARQPEIDALNDEISLCHGTLKSRERNIDAFQSELEGKKRVIETIKGVEKILRDDIERLCEENTALKAENERLKACHAKEVILLREERDELIGVLHRLTRYFNKDTGDQIFNRPKFFQAALNKFTGAS